MGAVIVLLEVVAILLVSFLLTVKLVPWASIRIGRRLGFTMRATPITLRRITRFKRIKRGYYAFLLICTFYVTSLFLELVVNDKALVICYDGRYAFPAVAEWINQWNPFFTLPTYVRGGDVGLAGDENVHFRRFQAYCRNPELLKAEALACETDLVAQEKALEARGDPPFKPAAVPEPAFPPAPEDPGAGAPEKDRRAYRRAYEQYKQAVAAFEREQWEAIDAYDVYCERLREWEDYQGTKEALERVRRKAAALRASYDTFRAGKAWVVMPLYPYGPSDHFLSELPAEPPFPPSWWPYLKSLLTGEPIPGDPEERARQKILPIWSHPFGTTDKGLDVFPQLAYGFRISLTFAIIVAFFGYSIGVIVGGIMGYYGGWTDILVQRFIEIYQSIPFLYAIMIMASIMRPGMIPLAVMLVVLRSWLGITNYVRGEFYREKAKDYVQSAIGTGVSDWKVMTRHILPNSLVPVVTFAPFSIVSYILVLVSLDYLMLGLPPGTPSWGYLLSQGHTYLLSYPHLILIPSLALAATLFCVVMVGEATREAFDPKIFSRLR